MEAVPLQPFLETSVQTSTASFLCSQWTEYPTSGQPWVPKAVSLLRGLSTFTVLGSHSSISRIQSSSSAPSMNSSRLMMATDVTRTDSDYTQRAEDRLYQCHLALHLCLQVLMLVSRSLMVFNVSSIELQRERALTTLVRVGVLIGSALFLIFCAHYTCCSSSSISCITSAFRYALASCLKLCS